MLNGQFHVYICLCFGLVLVIPESFLNKQIEKKLLENEEKHFYIIRIWYEYFAIKIKVSLCSYVCLGLCFYFIRSGEKEEKKFCI